MTLWDLAVTFFKIGLFSFGGGYAMLPMIQQEVVHNHLWVSSLEFTDIVAISQITPGPISINAATYIGFLSTNSILGSAVTTLGLCLPSLIIMLLFSKYYTIFKDNIYLTRAFDGLRPVVIGLIGAAALLLLNKENFIDYKSVFFFLGACILIGYWKLNPIVITVIAAAVGILVY